MRHPLIVIASTGLVTNLSWWQTISVNGESLVLQSAGDEPRAELIVASLSSEREAQSLMNALMDRTRFGARSFDVRLWSSA